LNINSYKEKINLKIMGSEVRVIYEKPSFAKKEAFEEPFYCKESPFEVLKELIPIYHIEKYNTLDTHLGVMGSIPAKSDHPGILLGNPIWITGLSINHFQPKGIEITQSVKEYTPGVKVGNLTNPDEKINIFNRFIERYLIRTEVVKEGYATENYLHQRTVHKSGKQKAIEYLKEREEKVDDKKEENLEDILDYGKVIFGEDFNLKRLRRISRKIARNIPKKIESVRVDYFTLRPESDFGFRKIR